MGRFRRMAGVAFLAGTIVGGPASAPAEARQGRGGDRRQATGAEAPPEPKAFEEATGSRWFPYLEWSIEDTSHDGNPFDLEAKAVFTHVESDRTIETDLFHDGGDTWTFRFTGTLAGDWTFRTVADDGDLGGWTGRVRVVENDDPHAHGFMKALGNKWGWQGTERPFIPQYVMGKSPSAYLDDEGEVIEAMIDDDVAEFVDGHGFTGFHVAMAGRWFDGEDPDVRVYRALEYLIREVHREGGACHLWMWGSRDANPERITGGPLSAMDRRNLRYLASRLGPIPGWSIGYGFDTENGWAGVEELDAWKSFLGERMGWDHFLGARVGYDEKGLFAVSPRPPRPPHDAGFRAPVGDEYATWLGGDYVGYTSYRPLYPRYYQVLHHRPDRPSFEEDRFRLRALREWEYKDYDAELTRRGLWHSAMAGGVANIWGNLLPDGDRGGSRPYEIKDQIKTYSLFFRDRFLEEMMTEYVGPELRLAVPEGDLALVYREDTDRVRLGPGRTGEGRPAVAVDAKAPYREIDLGVLPPGPHAWEAPYRSDWAVAVGRFPGPGSTAGRGD